MKNKKIGKIIIPGKEPIEEHELETARILVSFGKDVEFLIRSYAKGTKSADLLMDGKIWEIKSPCGNRKRTIENNYRKAILQSENIIFDLTRIKLDEKTAIKYIKQQFNLRPGKTKQIMIILKNKKILDFLR